MLRAVADAENARKRAQTEASAAQKYALERFAEQLLPVVDSLQAALGSEKHQPRALPQRGRADPESSSGRRSSAPTSGKSVGEGRAFRPPSPPCGGGVEARGCEPNTVVSLMQKGYTLHDRVLRPALVTVAKELENDDRNPISDIDLD